MDAVSAAGPGGGAALERAAHKLRGSAGNVGAHGVASLCEELETVGRSGGCAASGQTERLRAELDRACRTLQELVAVRA